MGLGTEPGEVPLVPPEGVGLVLDPLDPVPREGVGLVVGLVLDPPDPVPREGVGLVVGLVLDPPDPVPLDPVPREGVGLVVGLVLDPPDPVPPDGCVVPPELGVLYVRALVMVWLVPSGAITFTSICPATAGGAITVSMVGAPSSTRVVGCPPISTLAPDGMAVP